MKLVPLVLLPYFLLRRTWLWLLVSIALIAAWCLLPAVVAGRKIVEIYEQFWSVLLATSLPAQAQPLDFSVAGTLASITGAPLTTALKASAAAVVLGWIMPVDARRLRLAASDTRPFALYLLAIPLLSPQSEVHHLAFMLPAAAIVGAVLWWDWPQATVTLRASALFAVALYLAASATPVFAGPLFCASLIAVGVAVMKMPPSQQP